MDAIRKHLALRVPTVALLWGIVAAQLPVFVAWALVPESRPFDPMRYLPWGLAVLLINLGANLAFIKALETGALSRTIPVLSLTPVITIAAAAALLGEQPTRLQSLGIAAVVAGTGLLALRRDNDDFRLEPGILLMLGVATAWSISAALDKVALGYISVPGHGLAQSVGLLAALTIVLIVQRRLQNLRSLRPSIGGVVIAAILMAAAASLQYMALETILVSLVETIKRAIGAGFALTVGSLFFGERVGVPQILAALLIVAGTILIFGA